MTKKKASPTAKNKQTPHPQRKHRYGGCLLLVFSALLLSVLLLVGGISFYVFQAAVCPNLLHRENFCNTAMSEEESLSQMYSDYPYTKPWLRRLRRDDLLKEATIYAANDSTPLHAYYVAANKPTPHTAVVVHGYKSCALEMLHIAYMYHHDLGFNVLLPDLRTHGKSGGEYIGFGWTEKADLMQWMDYANQLFAATDGGQTQMVVHGVSMGAATTMFVAGESRQPDYVRIYIEDCGYSSVIDEIAYVAKRDYGMNERPFVSLASQICQWCYGWNFSQASCIEAVSRSTRPMLFIHGTSDRYVPFHMAQELYAAKPNNKELWEVKDVIHARSYHDHKDEYTQRCAAFINQYFYGE